MSLSHSPQILMLFSLKRFLTSLTMSSLTHGLLRNVSLKVPGTVLLLISFYYGSIT